MKKQHFKLDIESIKKGLAQAGLYYARDTKAYIIFARIFQTKDMWHSIMSSKVEKVGNNYVVKIGSNPSRLGRRRKISPKNRKYPVWVHDGTTKMTARPFFDITYRVHKSRYDQIIKDAVDVNIQ